jgi:predicted XRE-type DNA-binding protein
MPSAKAVNKPGHITTGNVLEDLGFSAEEIREIVIKHDLWAPIREEIESRKLTQAKLSKALQIHQPDASLLLRGQIERFSITRLLQFAERLGLKVTINVAPAPAAQPLKQRREARIPMRKPPVRIKTGKSLAEPKALRNAALG